MTAPLRLVIELDHGGDPIAGALRACDGAARPFVGYAELMAELEALRALHPSSHGGAELGLHLEVDS